MPKPLSLDLRQRIIDALQAGESCDDVAERFAVSPSGVRRIRQRFRERQTLVPLSNRPHRKPMLDDRVEEIRTILKNHPGITAPEVRRKLGVTCCVNTVWRAIRRLGMTFKKNDPRRRATPAGRPGKTPDDENPLPFQRAKSLHIP